VDAGDDGTRREGNPVIALRVAAFVLGALVLQGALERVVGGEAIDLGLVAVVSVALLHGRVAGLLAGTLAGLVQDALGGGVLGMSGLGKSMAGYLTGVVGTQFIVTQAVSRFFVFLGATVLNRALFVGLSMLLGLRRYDRPYLDVAFQGVGNAVLGVLLFHLIEFLPGAGEWWRLVLERRRKRRFH
jgi:rod shape-determining protein MreD